MSAHGFVELFEHVGHKLVCVSYGDPENPDNVAVECETCHCVLLDFDNESWPVFRNHYTCPRCQHEWTDEWESMCDDDCPNCGCRHISPAYSEDLHPDSGHTDGR